MELCHLPLIILVIYFQSEVDEVEVETTTLEFPEGIEEITEITVIQVI